MKAIIKGVVLEKQNREATVLTSDGQFKRIQVQEAFEIGDEVSGSEMSKKGFNYKLYLFSSIAVAAVLLIAFMVPGFVNYFSKAPNMATEVKPPVQVLAYVQVDINPSIEIGYDDDLKVKEVNGLNLDGEKVLAQGELENLEVTEAIEKIALWSADLGYLAEDKENQITLTYSEDVSEELSLDLEKVKEETKEKVQVLLASKGLTSEIKNKAKEKKDRSKPNNNSSDKDSNSNASDAKNNSNSKNNNGNNNNGNNNNNKNNSEKGSTINNNGNSHGTSSENINKNSKNNDSKNNSQGKSGSNKGQGYENKVQNNKKHQ